MGGHAAWDLYPLPTFTFTFTHSICAVSWDFPGLFQSGCWSEANLVMYPLLFLFPCLFSSVQSLGHVRLCNPMNRSTPGLPVHHQLLEFTPTHVHWVSDSIQPSHPLSSPSPPALNLSQHQDLFKWVSSLHQVAKVLEFQLQHQSFQWTPRTDLL